MSAPLEPAGGADDAHGHEAPPVDHRPRLAGVVDGLDRGWAGLAAMQAPLLALVLLALAVGRSGVALGRSDVNFWVDITRTFPDPPSDWRANSVVGPAIGRMLGVTGSGGWFWLHGAATAGVAVGAAWCIRSRFASSGGRRLAAVWLSIGALPPTLLQKIGSYDLLQKIGSYDPFTALGALLIVFGGSPAMAAFGGMLLGFTSADQGVAGLMCASLVAVALGGPAATYRSWRSRLVRTPLLDRLAVALVALVVARLATLALYARRGLVIPSRRSVAGDLLDRSLHNAFGAGGAGVYAWLGLAWGVVALGWLLGRWDRSTTIAVLGALLVPAAFVTAITLDGTRVFVMISLPAVLVVLGWVVDRVESGPDIDALLAHRFTIATLVAAPLVPALLAEPNGGRFFVFPWGR